MKNQVAKCNRSARIYSVVFKFWVKAVIVLLISGCGLEKDASGPAAGQSSD
jgi:hypothetical protein